MTQVQSTSFRGDLGRAFQLAEVALSAIGFRITRRTNVELEMAGPGMTSSRGSPLLGASRIAFVHQSNELTMVAELGGAERLGRFATLFPVGLCLALGIIMAIIFGLTIGRGPWMAALVPPLIVIVAIWLILGPIIARSIRNRTIRALDSLLANMVVTGEAQP